METSRQRFNIKLETIISRFGPLLFAGSIICGLLSDITYPASTRLSDKFLSASIKLNNTAQTNGVK